MEINLGHSFGGNMGVKLEPSGAGVENVQRTAADAAQASPFASNLTIGEGIAGLSSAEPTAAVPESALSKDDDLGKMVSAAFNLQAPPMPNFGSEQV